MTVSNKIALLVLSSLPWACGNLPLAGSNPAIYQGSIDSTHDAVGLLVRDGKLWCTATLIGPQTALSAGHCFEGKNEKPASLFLRFNQGTIESQVIEVVVHPKYSEWFGRVTNDVAILKLATQPGLTPYVLSSQAPKKGEPVLFVGYGFTDATHKASFDGTKRSGKNIVGTVESNKIFYPKPTTPEVSQVCKGDSGGPIFANRNDQLEVIGIVSGSADGASSKTCQIESYSARVDAYRSWIDPQVI